MDVSKQEKTVFVAIKLTPNKNIIQIKIQNTIYIKITAPSPFLKKNCR